MKLYYAPGACSLCDHIALEEAALPYELEAVDLRTHRTAGGRDFHEINPKGYVPALEVDDGSILTENITLLAYIAETAGKLMPAGFARWRVAELLAFIGSEIHAGYNSLNAQDRHAARAKLAGRYRQIADAMGDDPFAVGTAMSIADCYLFVTLMWARQAEVPIPQTLSRYYDRISKRPAVERALAQEGLA